MIVRATSFDLKAELLIPNRIKTYEKIEVDFLEIKATDHKAKYTHFNEIKFKSLVLFDHDNLSPGVLFENCEFFEATVFKDAIVTLFDQLITTDSVSIVFKNCIFHGIVEFFGIKYPN